MSLISESARVLANDSRANKSVCSQKCPPLIKGENAMILSGCEAQVKNGGGWMHSLGNQQGRSESRNLKDSFLARPYDLFAKT